MLLVVAFAASCRRQPVPPEAAFSHEYIVLDAAPGASGTKGFINSEDLLENGTSFEIHDYLWGYNGTVSQHTDEEFQYFTNSLTYNSASTDWNWVFGDVASPTSYRWTRTGKHNFYGWLLNDAKSSIQSSTFFDTYTPGTKQLTVAKTLTIDSPQYDFLYSDVVRVDVVEDGTPVTVPIPMRHLFGALGMTIQNTSEVDVIVYGVTLQNFPNSCTKTITFTTSGDNPGVTVSGNSQRSNTVYWPNKISTSGVMLRNINHAESGKILDVFTGQQMGESLSYRLAWPVTKTSLEPIYDNPAADANGNPRYASTSPLILVDCEVGSTGRAILKVPFKNQGEDPEAISAGKKTQINLSFADKQVMLSYLTLPWDYEEYPMAFEKDAVSATQLKFSEGTYTPNIPKLTTADGIRHDVIQLTASSNPQWVARGSFKIYTPVNGRLVVGMSGDTDDFIVTLDSGNPYVTENSTVIYTGEGRDFILIDPNRDGGQVTLSVKPNGTPQSGKKVFLHFVVVNQNRDTDADSEINRDNYVITIP